MSEGHAATAFVPGHVTGFFSIHRTDDPATTGSRGGGLALADGVTVTVEPASDTTVTVEGETMAIDAVDGVLSTLGETADVTVETDLPLGAGFGVSGAMALGTALAGNQVFDVGRSENALVRLAHVAEVEAGTGLGDVVAQARGGVPLRLEPGAPPEGVLDGIPAVADVEYLTLGELSTPDVLADRPERITRAGTAALETVRERPTLDRFMTAAVTFSEDVGLLTGEVREVVEAVEAAGGTAAMAMLGETVYALGDALSAAGFEARRTHIHRGGATLLVDGPSA
ncbi:MAG: pantoate kinase [Halanaeroarchaeum sp.]